MIGSVDEDGQDVQINQDLIDRLSEILEVNKTKSMGFTNVNQFTNHIIQETLEDMERQAGHCDMSEGTAKTSGGKPL